MRVLRIAAVAVAAFVVLPSCSTVGVGTPVFKADFARAVQVFPGVKVRVLGVNVGVVTDIRDVAGSAEVTFRLDRGVKLPAGVQAAVVPVSLLGERYIQLFPAYQRGPVLKAGSTIPLSRTAVPSEPDDLLRALENYMGQLDPNTVSAFVNNAATILQGTGSDLNQLIAHGASVMQTLDAKGGDLAQMTVELNKLAQALSTRQQALGQLIRSYDTVSGTLTSNRQALEGTITGLNAAAVQLASLLIAHKSSLESDVATLTRTGRTLSRNAETFAQTGHWATLLFMAASRAVDYNKDWLRLGNQGQELGALILLRLEQRLEGLCAAANTPTCSTPTYWAIHVPKLFCFTLTCPTASAPGTGNPDAAAKQLTTALQRIKKIHDAMSSQATAQDTTIESLIRRLLDQTVGNPFGLGGLPNDPFGLSVPATAGGGLP